MIKFFRQIRYNFISENKTGKYLKYALGEIILVVIGILIALQVNNWNENRKERHVELKILKSIENDITEDIKNMTAMIATEEIGCKRNKKLISILKDSTSEYEVSMDTLFGNINRYDVFYPQKIGFESLKSIGLEVVQSDSLKAAIVNLYDYHYGIIAETLDIKKQLYLNTNTIFIEHLRTVDLAEGFDGFHNKRPNNFEALKTNDSFLNHLSHIYMERLTFLSYAQNIKKIMEEVQQKLLKEIKATSNG
jgi:hypothetical protein